MAHAVHVQATLLACPEQTQDHAPTIHTDPPLQMTTAGFKAPRHSAMKTENTHTTQGFHSHTNANQSAFSFQHSLLNTVLILSACSIHSAQSQDGQVKIKAI